MNADKCFVFNRRSSAAHGFFGFFSNLLGVAEVCTTAVFGYAGPDGPAKADLSTFSSLRVAVHSELAGLLTART
jgi:hypothetical protein